MFIACLRYTIFTLVRFRGVDLAVLVFTRRRFVSYQLTRLHAICMYYSSVYNEGYGFTEYDGSYTRGQNPRPRVGVAVLLSTRGL